MVRAAARPRAEGEEAMNCRYRQASSHLSTTRVKLHAEHGNSCTGMESLLAPGDDAGLIHD